MLWSFAKKLLKKFLLYLGIFIGCVLIVGELLSATMHGWIPNLARFENKDVKYYDGKTAKNLLNDKKLFDEFDTVVIAAADLQPRSLEEWQKELKALAGLKFIPLSFPRAAEFHLYLVGDITQNATSEQIKWFLMFKDGLISDFQNIGIRLTINVICGNHDTKQGNAACVEISGVRDACYSKRIWNITTLFFSNKHYASSVKCIDCQRHIPTECLEFLEKNGSRSLNNGDILMLVVHEKPKGIARLSDPARYLASLLGNSDKSSLWNSDEWLSAISRLPKNKVDQKSGVSVLNISAHSHKNVDWFNTLTIQDGILYISIPAIRTSDFRNDLDKYSINFLLKKSGVKINLKWLGSRPLAYLLSKLFPWSRENAVLIFAYNKGSKDLYIFPYSLSRNRFYDFFYKVRMSEQFK